MVEPSRSATPAASSVGVPDTWTVGQLLSWTHTRFTEAGIDDARTDAEHLLAHALGCDRMSLYVHHDKVVNVDERATFRTLVRRRLTREPVAYIEGKRGFHALGLELRVDRRVLIPRPETEHLVDWVLEELRPPPAPPMAILDVGTGSGAIALAIKHARPELDVVACDLSPQALDVARENAEQLQVHAQFVVSDLLAEVHPPTDGWTVIVANLPYVRRDVWPTLQPEVQRFEPRMALDGGTDGLQFVRRLVTESPAQLAPGGGLYLEIGYDQGAATAALLHDAGFEDVQLRRDYAGHERIVRGFWPR